MGNAGDCELSRRNIDVQQYATTARKKASLMTNYDFNDRERASSRSRSRSSTSSYDREKIIQGARERTRRRSVEKTSHSSLHRSANDGHNEECDNDEDVQNYFEEQAQANHIPPPTATTMVGQYIPSSANSAATSVSSMTSKDSYVRQQLFLRDLARYKRALREAGHRFHSLGEDDEEDDYIEGGEGDEEEHVIQEEYEEDEENSMFENKSKIHQFCEMGEGDGLSAIDYNDIGDGEEDDVMNSKSIVPKRRYTSRSTASRTRGSSSRSGNMHKKSSTVCTPVYQLEECCIKHPHVLLQDQTNVNIWTCMRYCKDPKTGRWVTVKKVCVQCLGEMDGEDAYEDWEQHASAYERSRCTRSSSGRQHHSHQKGGGNGLSHSTDEDTWSNSSDDEEGGYSHSQRRGETVSVYGDDGNQTPLEREAEAQRRRFVRRLAARAYHFPGNTWFEDWLQYTKNTHLVFGIFFHHPLHPVTSKERCIILLGSVAVGLLMSNLIYLWFVEANFGMHDPVISLGPDGKLAITKLMVTLWTLGSFVHTIFDLCVWHIKACTLCRYGGNVSDRAVKCGRSTGVTIVMLTLAFATYMVLLRASEDFKTMSGNDVDETETGDKADSNGSFFHSVTLGGGVEHFDFLLGYFVEFILAVFVYSPLILTVVFTGILGCDGRIPVLGGRPREVAKEQRYAMKRQRYIMPQTLKLGDNEYEADLWYDQKLATNF